MNLEKNILRDVVFKTFIDRGSAEILEEDEQGIFVKDTWSIAFFLVCEDFNRGVEWLEKHKERDYELLAVYSKELRDYAIERFGFNDIMDCQHAVWTKDSPPERAGNLRIIKGTEEDVPFVREHYDAWDEEWCMELFERGNIYVAKLDDGTPVGFIGEHLEGAIGLLYVLPEYRNRGYAEEMEVFMIEMIMDRGLIPYGQVVLGNEKSMALQKKMGFEFWDGVSSWLFKIEDL